MGFLDRARSLLRSPADRRLERAAAAFDAAPKPRPPSDAAMVRAQPFGGGMQPPGRPPAINWIGDQMPPPPRLYTHSPGYSDHTFQSLSAPLGFEGFTLDRIRSAVASHRLGFFVESSTLMVALMGFAPVLAALQQAIAPILALRRHIHGGDKGLAKMIAAEIEAMLVPRGGLLPSPYLPPSLWGTLAIYLRMMGFAVLQHVDGDPDPDTGVRERYTRIWEPWAVNRYRSPRKAIALTTEGPVEIKNDGHFTLVEDENEGYLTGAICCLGDETLAGKLTQEARNSWIDFFGKPKLYATLPEKVPTHGEAGNAFEASVETIYGPDGRGVLPYGSTLDAVSISGEGTKAFQDALLDVIIHIYMVLTGSAGTIGSGGPTGAGPYQPQKGGPWNVRHDLIARPTICIVRAMNEGIISPYCEGNYADAIAAAKRAGTWKEPVLEIPIPAPDRDERIKSEIDRQKALSDQVQADRAAGAIVDQDRVDKLAARFEADPFTLADEAPRAGEIFEYHIEQKLVAPDEVRARLGLDPLPDGVGSVKTLAAERAQGKDKTGSAPADAAMLAAEAKPVGAEPPADDGAQEGEAA